MKFCNNQYFILRHGESLNNTKKVVSCWPEKFHCPLTLKGRKEIKETAKKLKNQKIDLIFSSDLLRTKQTAEIIAKKLGIKKIFFDKRLREVNVGIFNGKSIDEFLKFWNIEKKLFPLKFYLERFQIALPKGENYSEIEKRMLDFIKEIDKKYHGKNILIISHGRSLTLLEKAIYNYSFKKFIRINEKKEIKKGEVRKLLKNKAKIL